MQLPNEVLQSIFEHVEESQVLVHCMQVCQLWKVRQPVAASLARKPM
jgi:hypothetical protein